MFAKLTQTAGPDSALAAMAPDLDWVLMLRADQDEYAIHVRHGVVEKVTQGPFVMPSWQTSMTASRVEWDQFLAPVPKPGHHDIIALLRRSAIQFEGDLHPLMANLYYVKKLLESLRGAE